MKRDEKLMQPQLAFYKLYTSFKEKPDRYVAAWEFVGEIFVKELNKWGLMSYKCPARLSEMMKANPGLIERTTVHGKSGARYFAYRINPYGASAVHIKDPQLVSLYNRIKK